MAVYKPIFAVFPIVQETDIAYRAEVTLVEAIILNYATVTVTLTDDAGTQVGDLRHLSVPIPPEQFANFRSVIHGDADQTVIDAFHTFILDSETAANELPVVNLPVVPEE